MVAPLLAGGQKADEVVDAGGFVVPLPVFGAFVFAGVTLVFVEGGERFAISHELVQLVLSVVHVYLGSELRPISQVLRAPTRVQLGFTTNQSHMHTS